MKPEGKEYNKCELIPKVWEKVPTYDDKFKVSWSTVLVHPAVSDYIRYLESKVKKEEKATTEADWKWNPDKQQYELIKER
jgi:hypothetical protein